jgi:hypothetical protein
MKAIGNWDKKKNIESIIQDDFPPFMSQLFEDIKITFHDTHTNQKIATPQKPDITITQVGFEPTKYTALGFVELKHTNKSLDGAAKGEIISAVNNLYNHINSSSKREIWGFLMNGGDDNNFVYVKHQNGIFYIQN